VPWLLGGRGGHGEAGELAKNLEDMDAVWTRLQTRVANEKRRRDESEG
jgi:hypothetical protein